MLTRNTCQMPWKELSRIALLGTSHSSLSEASLQQLQGQGIDMGQQLPTVLADGAAMFAQMHKAGFPLEKFSGEMPTALENTGEPQCSLRSATHLQLILEGKYAEALPEFIALLLENGRVLPTEHLPSLLQRPDLGEWWEVIQPALGARGRWLLAQHPDWRKWLDNADSIDWQTGSQQERLRLLRHLRKQNPAEALEILQSTWEAEGHRERAAFLAELVAGLGAGDEVFLENCLDDRRKEVRLKAAELLTNLPDSEFAERMFQRAAACFQWSRGRIELVLPEAVTKEAARDGILTVHPDWKGGAKAAYLGQVVAAVPPSRWELVWEMPPTSIWRHFAGTDWAATLGIALAKAAHLHEDVAWMELLFEAWFEEEDSPLWNAPVGHQLMEAASTTMVNRLALAYLERHLGLPDQDAPLFQFFLINDSPWDDELSMQLVSRFRAWLRQTQKPDLTSFHFKEILKMVSYRCRPGLYEQMKQGWKTDVPLWPFWEKSVETMLEVVFFRLEMAREMAGEA